MLVGLLSTQPQPTLAVINDPIHHRFSSKINTEAARFLAAAIVAGSHYTYEITTWGTYLMFVAISIIGVFLNLFAYPILNRWNEAARKPMPCFFFVLPYTNQISLVYWSVLSVVVISIILLAKSPKTDAEFVFTNFSNTTGWSDGTAWILGLLQSALSFVGYVYQRTGL